MASFEHLFAHIKTQEMLSSISNANKVTLVCTKRDKDNTEKATSEELVIEYPLGPHEPKTCIPLILNTLSYLINIANCKLHAH